MELEVLEGRIEEEIEQLDDDIFIQTDYLSRVDDKTKKAVIEANIHNMEDFKKFLEGLLQ